jgi:toxin-antitoxin system PIN domain toxin
VVLPDVSVLVYAHREDAPHHALCHAWLEAVVNGQESYALSELVLSGFLRVVTHPKVFTRPSPLADALEFTEQLRSLPGWQRSRVAALRPSVVRSAGTWRAAPHRPDRS